MRPTLRIGSGLAVLGLLALVVGTATSGGEVKKPAPVSAEAARFFETKVRPLLADNCFKCHGGPGQGEKKVRGNLRLDSLGAVLEGGDQGPAIVPGHPEKSLLIKAISYDDVELK